MTLVKTLATVAIKPTNGNATNTTKTDATPAVVIAEKTPVINPIIAKAEKYLNIADRLKRLDELKELQKVYDKINESLENLQKFTTSNPHGYANICITDDNENEIFIRNNDVISEIVQIIIEKLTTKREAAADLLKW